MVHGFMNMDYAALDRGKCILDAFLNVHVYCHDSVELTG